MAYGQPGKVPVPGKNDLRPSEPMERYGDGRNILRHAVGNTMIFDFRAERPEYTSTSPASATRTAGPRKQSPRA